MLRHYNGASNKPLEVAANSTALKRKAFVFSRLYEPLSALALMHLKKAGLWNHSKSVSKTTLFETKFKVQI
jgi:hypothetical protein